MKTTWNTVALMLAFAVALAFTGAPILAEKKPEPKADEEEKEDEDEKKGGKDDWVLDLPGQHAEGRAGAPFFKNAAPSAMRMAPAAGGAASLGFAVGGAKDINNFRKNIENNFLPQPSDVTVEGLYYDYFFDMGQPAEPCRKLFCPVYSLAVSPDPLSGEKEYYMAVGLTSDMKASDFQRKKLNLVVVLDISGSMSSPFRRYYYDGKPQPPKEGEKEDSRTKMVIAREAVQELTRHLRDDDRFGMVVFDNQGYLAKPLNPVGGTDLEKIRGHIGKLTPRGGTNFEAGYRKATELLEERRDDAADEYENRIIFLTDAMPNIGQIEEEGLFGLTEKNARRRIHTTFVGIGVDFNSTLIEEITKVRGANYFSVHSSTEFKKLLADDFAYMVTPMVFDLSLKLEAGGIGIDQVYGSPEADLATGELMRVNTLFPSRTEDEAVKGGLVLLKLSGDPRGKELRLKASYETRDGSRENDSQLVTWKGPEDETATAYDNTGIRKGILLARYANLLVHWMREERTLLEIPEKPEKPGAEAALYCALREMPERGIVIPPEVDPGLGKWERQSVPLSVNPASVETLSRFLNHFEKETTAIGDETLDREPKILRRLLKVADPEKEAPGKKDDWQLKRGPAQPRP